MLGMVKGTTLFEVAKAAMPFQFFDLVLNIPPGFCVPGFQLFVQALVFDLGLPVFTCTIRAFC